ncbi:MAG: amino acid ABC transporter substrate-binding protein [bacterium]|nr:amino acid ABC transporter substrate-binding protein [bacterium]
MENLTKKTFIGLLAFFIFIPGVLSSAETVKVYTYHLMPPYIIDEKKQTGIYYDFSRYMNSKTKKYKFVTRYTPRKRLNQLIKNKKLDGILLGVNPTWFKDRARVKFLWTSAIIKDRDEVVSNKQRKVRYTGPQSLKGMRLGGVRGFYYFGIDDLVKKKQITRDDSHSETANLKKLLRQRLDITIVSTLSLKYLVKKYNWQNKFYVSPKPHDSFKRHVMIPRSKRKLYNHISPIVRKMLNNPKWKRMLRKY